MNTLQSDTLILRTDDFLTSVSVANLSGVTLIPVAPTGQHLEGKTLEETVSLVVEANWLLSQKALGNRTDIAAGFSSLRTVDLFPNLWNPPLSSEFIVHFRGTDQLSRDWRPPPLAFFVRAAVHAKAASVLLVTDDPNSHLVIELLSRLSAEGISSRVQSTSLERDMNTILGASTLCFGVGTFASSLAGVSPNLQRTYSWSQPDWSTWADFWGSFDLRPDVENFRVFDVSKKYVSRFLDVKEFSDADVADHMVGFDIENLQVERIAPSPIV